ncbi:replication protein [Clostridium sporogenes]|nr:replication protein [Clostridium botulinum]MBE6077033.1 replication protein [Clostridium lundense]NFG95477.1 replication protein [Clostridium sporogenes]NFH31628.1 replication protein [Clostridium sporogenes]NFL19034.1 replication protein [Clostridium sporogenes]
MSFFKTKVLYTLNSNFLIFSTIYSKITITASKVIKTRNTFRENRYL